MKQIHKSIRYVIAKNEPFGTGLRRVFLPESGSWFWAFTTSTARQFGSKKAAKKASKGIKDSKVMRLTTTKTLEECS
jgi:hypothetical protein